jgi:hypothetical protein
MEPQMNADKHGSGKARGGRAGPRGKLAKLAKRTGVIVGDPGRLSHIRTFDETKWRRKWGKRLK